MKEKLKKDSDINDTNLFGKIMDITNDDFELLDDFEIEWKIKKKKNRK